MDTQLPQPIVQPPPPIQQRVRVGPIIRDVFMVWVFTLIGGFVVGLATGGAPRSSPGPMLAIAASNLLLGIVAFTISGCLAPPRRWRHLGLVAFGAWITSLLNVVLFGVGFVQWIGGAIFLAIIMGIGGAISYIFKRDEKPSA